MESWFVVIFITVLAGLYSLSYLLSLSSKHGRLPPGPLGLPVIGHLHMLGVRPHQSLQQLAKKYGPIMSIRLGNIPTMVISSPEWAELLLKTHDTVFASRPKIQAADCIAYGQKNIGFAEYGPYWRNIRKLCMIELLSSSKIESFMPMRREELFNFVKFMKTESDSQSMIDVTAKTHSFIEQMIFRMIFGYKDCRFNFMASIQETFLLIGAFNVGDCIPWLKPFDLQGLGRRIKACSKALDGFLETIVDEHVQEAKELQC